MRKFVMVRNHDSGGVSGTGRVLEGIEFSNGKVAVTWLGKGLSAMSVAVYDSLDDFRAIHVELPS